MQTLRTGLSNMIAGAKHAARILVMTAALGGTALAEMKKEIVMGIGPDFGTSTHAIIALKKGFFEKEGLNVELRKFAAGLIQAEALAAGNLDFAVPAQGPVYSLRSAGIPIVFLANTAIWSDAFGLVVSKDSGINNASDLAGKKIAMLKGSTAELMYRAILEQYGLEAKSVQSLSMKPPAQLSALISGSIDGLVVWEPWVQKAIDEGKGIKRHSGSTSMFKDSNGQQATVDWTRTVLTTLEPTIKGHPETVDAVVRAFVSAQDYISDPSNIDDVIKTFSEYHEQKAETNAALFPKFDMNMRLDADFLKGMEVPLKFLTSIGRIKKAVPVQDYIYTESLAKARPDWVSISSNFEIK